MAKNPNRGDFAEDAIDDIRRHWLKNRHRFAHYPPRALNVKLQETIRGKLNDLHKWMSAQKRRANFETEELPADDLISDGSARDEDTRIIVRDAVKRLTPLQQEICNFLEHGVGPTDIANALGKNINQINYQIRLIRKSFYQQGVQKP